MNPPITTADRDLRGFLADLAAGVRAGRSTQATSVRQPHNRELHSERQGLIGTWAQPNAISSPSDLALSTFRHAKLWFVEISVILAATACGSAAVQPPPTAPQSPPSPNATAPQSPPSPKATTPQSPRSSNAAAPVRPLVQQLAGEVSGARAVKHLQALQKIADEHDGNRAAGTSGYDASVKYVVDVLRNAGFKASTPTYEASGEDGEDSSGPQRNVIAQTRTGNPDQVVMIGAHLDSVERRPGHRRQRLRGGDPAGDRHPARR